MSTDDEDRPDLGGPEEELERMSSQRRGARSIGREQAIPILFVVVAVVLLLWWIIGLRPNPSTEAVVPTSTLSAAAFSTPVVTLTLATAMVITDTGTVVAVGTVELPTPEAGTPAAAAFSVGQSVKVSGTGSDQLSLRGGPGVNNARLTLLPDGTVLKVVGGPEEGSCGATEPCRWWRLEMATGTVGWAVESNLVPVEP